MDTIIALVKLPTIIVCRGKSTTTGEIREGSFSRITGERLRGNLEIEPEEVLFRTWAQVRPEKESALRKTWQKMRATMLPSILK